jgi:hypothetical protein
MILTQVCLYREDALSRHVFRQKGLAQLQRGPRQKWELNLDSFVMEIWKRELKNENEGKVGEPYQLLSRVVHQAPRLRQAPLCFSLLLAILVIILLILTTFVPPFLWYPSCANIG